MASKQFQPMMSDVKPSLNIQQGVVDNSEAVRIGGETALIGGLGKMALDANRGYELARLEREHEDTIQKFMGPRQDLAEAGLFRERIDKMWADSTNDQTTLEAVNPLEQEFKAKLDRYKRAEKEGLMSPQEFQLRIMKETREAVNRLPGIFPELIEHSKKVLGLSGINDIVKLTEEHAAASQKAAEEERKFWRDKAVPLGVSPNDPLLKQKVLKHNADITFFNMFTAADKFDEQQRNAIIRNPQMLNQLFDGAATSLTVAGTSLITATHVPPEQRIQELNAAYDGRKRAMLNSFGDKAGEKVVQDNIKMLDEQRDMYVNIITGRLPKEAAENHNSWNKAREEARLDIPKASALLPFWNAIGEVGRSEAMKKGYMEPMWNVLSGKSAIGLDWSRPQTKETMLRFTGEAVKQADSGNPANLNNVMQSYHATIADPLLTNDQRASAATNFLQSMSAPGVNKTLEGLPLPARTQLLSDTRVYVSQLAEHIKTTKVYKDNTPVVLPSDLTLGIMGSNVVFRSLSNPQAELKLNTNFGNPLNYAIKTMANLHGHGDVRQMLQDKESGLADAFVIMAGGSGRASSGLVKQPAPKKWWQGE